LSMEWFPNDHEETNKNGNPSGTACIEVDIHTRQIRNIVFVQNTSFAENGDYPLSNETETVIEWVEELTDLTFGKQFQLVSEEKNAFNFQSVVDNIPVYPPGNIRVEFNTDNKLCLFSVDGIFPEEAKVEWEPFSLTPEKTDHIAKAQCHFVNIPYQPDETWLPFYMIEAVFLANDGVTTIPYEVSMPGGTVSSEYTVMEWEHPLDQTFTLEEAYFSPEITEETALLNKAHADSFPLTVSEQKACREAVLDFLRQVYPNSSGEWVLNRLYPENGYIHAVLQPVKRDPRIFRRKLTVVLNREQCKVIHYIDNHDLFDLFHHFQKAESAVLTQEEAFQKLREYVMVTPQYVYNNVQKSYILCGKVDCDYGVHAVTGEIIPLDDL